MAIEAIVGRFLRGLRRESQVRYLLRIAVEEPAVAMTLLLFFAVGDTALSIRPRFGSRQLFGDRELVQIRLPALELIRERSHISENFSGSTVSEAFDR